MSAFIYSTHAKVRLLWVMGWMGGWMDGRMDGIGRVDGGGRGWGGSGSIRTTDEGGERADTTTQPPTYPPTQPTDRPLPLPCLAFHPPNHPPTQPTDQPLPCLHRTDLHDEVDLLRRGLRRHGDVRLRVRRPCQRAALPGEEEEDAVWVYVGGWCYDFMRRREGEGANLNIYKYKVYIYI